MRAFWMQANSRITLDVVRKTTPDVLGAEKDILTDATVMVPDEILRFRLAGLEPTSAQPKTRELQGMTIEEL